MSVAAHFLNEIWRALGGDDGAPGQVAFTGAGPLPSLFAVGDLAAGAVAAAGLAVAEYAGTSGRALPAVTVDRRLASLWFSPSLRPEGWAPPPIWDPLAGDYAAADGWIRLHTNLPHHRDAALAVLGTPAERPAIAAAVATWRADALESAVLAAGGCAATMRRPEDWAAHPQGRAAQAEPLAWIDPAERGDRPLPPVRPERPLAGLRVLDLTRILAGPVATRSLAGFGAEVLRVDPPGWDEPRRAPDVTLGKRCARLDLRDAAGRQRFLDLLAETDVLVHGYRPGALDSRGLSRELRRRARPGLVEVCLDAYGWTGPWAGRRGFDSLVQMSCGIAAAGMDWAGAERPFPLPVQALDQATGYMMAAAALRGLTRRRLTGQGSQTRLSLARTAALLMAAPRQTERHPPLTPAAADYEAGVEMTDWGPVRRLRAPIAVAGAPMRWERPAGELGTSPAAW